MYVKHYRKQAEGFVVGRVYRDCSDTVYESVEEAKANGITIKESLPVEVGDWIQVKSGEVSKVYKVYNGACSVVVCTAFGRTGFRKSRMYNLLNPDGSFNLEKITLSRTAFVDDWLLKGLSITESAKSHLKGEYELYTKLKFVQCSSYRLKLFSYYILSGKWFETYMGQNRLIKDRYMSLIGALEEEGLTDKYIAETLKADIESESDKRHINALTHVITIKADDSKKKHLNPLLTFQVTNEEHLLAQPQQKALPQPTQSQIDEILQGVHDDLGEIGYRSKVTTEESRVENIPS